MTAVSASRDMHVFHILEMQIDNVADIIRNINVQNLN